jgi:hypothetical protein
MVGWYSANGKPPPRRIIVHFDAGNGPTGENGPRIEVIIEGEQISVYERPRPPTAEELWEIIRQLEEESLKEPARPLQPRIPVQYSVPSVTRNPYKTSAFLRWQARALRRG